MNQQNNFILFFSTEDSYLDEQHDFHMVSDASILPTHDIQNNVQFTEFANLYKKECVKENDEETDVYVYGSSYLSYDIPYPEDHNENYLTRLKDYFDNLHKQENIKLYLFLHEKDLYRDGRVDSKMFNSLGSGTYVWYITEYGRRTLNVPSDCDVYLFQHEGVCPVVEMLEKESITAHDINELINRVSRGIIQLFKEADNAVSLDMNEAKENLKSIKEKLKNGGF